MSERTFTHMLTLQMKARAIDNTIAAIFVLPNYEANKDLIKLYLEQLEELLAEMKEELK